MGRIDRRTGLSNVHGIVSDYRAWPLLVVTPPPYSVSDEALLEFMDLHTQLVRTMATPYALVLDLRDAGPMSAAQRKKLTSIMNDAKDNLAVTCRGAAFVFSSSMMRGMLTAVFWLFKPPYPVRVAPDLESAVEWAQRLVDTPSLERRRSA